MADNSELFPQNWILNTPFSFLDVAIFADMTLWENCFFWSVFSFIRTEYGDLRRKSLYSVQIQENTDHKKLRIWTFFTQCDSNTVKP